MKTYSSDFQGDDFHEILGAMFLSGRAIVMNMVYNPEDNYKRCARLFKYLRKMGSIYPFWE